MVDYKNICFVAFIFEVVLLVLLPIILYFYPATTCNEIKGRSDNIMTTFTVLFTIVFAVYLFTVMYKFKSELEFPGMTK